MLTNPDQNPDPIDYAATAANYTPPSQVATNHDIAALIEEQVKAALAQYQQQQAAAAAPVVRSPEEEARAALDNGGSGLGIEERFAELYRHIELIARKVGI